jgi:hypothetical protein
MIPKNEMFHEDCACTKNEWMTADMMDEWIRMSGKDNLDLYVTHQVMLSPSAFCGHLNEELKVKLERKNCDLVVIPGGITIYFNQSLFWLISHLI